MLSLEEFKGQVCQTVNQFLFGHPVSEQAFRILDTDKDGLMSPNEVFDVLKHFMEVSKDSSAMRNFAYSEKGTKS